MLLGLFLGPPSLDENAGKVELEGVGLHRQQEEDVPEHGDGIALKEMDQAHWTG